MKYLFKYGEINENHQDIADYERFYNYCLKVIENNVQMHDVILNILYISLNKFVNKHLISMTLRLIGNLNTPINISLDKLKAYLNNEQTRNATFLILKKMNEKRLNLDISKYIYDFTFESKEFFLFLTTMKEEINQFLNIKDPNYLRRQLLIMNYTNISRNTDYYFNYLGSNDKSMCYLVFEHLVMLLNQIKRDDLDSNKTKCYSLGDSNKTKCYSLGDSNNIQVFCDKDKDVYISLKNKIQVENVSNFLIFFLPFIRNKEKIYNFITKNNLTEISNCMKKYLLNNDLITISRHSHLYSTSFQSKTINNELYFEDENANFDFLFEDSSFKSHSDCVEL